MSGTIAIRVNKLWSVCHIHEAARVHQLRCHAAPSSSSSCSYPSSLLSSLFLPLCLARAKKSRGFYYRRDVKPATFHRDFAITYGYYPYLLLFLRRYPFRHGRNSDHRRIEYLTRPCKMINVSKYAAVSIAPPSLSLFPQTICGKIARQRRNVFHEKLARPRSELNYGTTLHIAR